MTLEDFETQVISICTDSPIVVSAAVAGTTITWLRIRAYLIDGSFIEEFLTRRPKK